MKCQNCGSEHGFRGEQDTKERKRESDGLMERYAVGPERIICKKCGEQVDPNYTGEDAEDELPEPPTRGNGGNPQVLSGVPKHLQGAFDNGGDNQDR